jgi:hypothetical protein
MKFIWDMWAKEQQRILGHGGLTASFKAAWLQ